MTPEELKAKYLNGNLTLKTEFLSSHDGRAQVIANAEKYAGWTLPTIFPDENVTNGDEMQGDYQSFGARAVNNLANKVMLALFQPSRPFFKMSLSATQREGLAGQLTEAQIDEALSKTERAAMKELDKISARPTLTKIVKHLIVTGNALLHMPKGSKAKMYNLRNYVCRRDLEGNVIKLIIKEEKALGGLPDEMQKVLRLYGYDDDEAMVAIYTGVVRTDDGRYVSWQEVEEALYASERMGIYQKEDLPWIPLTWELVEGKDYGTGLVEEYAGDFFSLSTNAAAILDYTVVSTDVKNLVNPAGMTDVRELTEAQSGAYVHGREEDLYVHTPNVSGNLEILTQQADRIERRLAAVFLLNSSVTRDAERVTAEEIRMNALELESSLGGVYSHLAAELQVPLAIRLTGSVNPVLKGVEPTIVTGLESLSRNSELDRIRAFFTDLVGMSDLPPQAAERLDFNELIRVLGTGHGVEYDKFLLSEEQVQSRRKQMMEQNAATAGTEAAAVEQGKQQVNNNV